MINQSYKKRMLITGVSGLLGNNLAYYLKTKYEILGLYNSHPVNIDGIQVKRCDLFVEDLIKEIIEQFRPDVIIHCAAVSNIDYCEDHRDEAYQANVVGTQNIVSAIISSAVKLIYISTDNFYDDTKETPLTESAPVKPTNYYGVTKLEGEQKALENEDALIIRTNIFGWNILDKYSLAEWVIHEVSLHREINSFKNTNFSSIYTFDLADSLDQGIEIGLSGIYNCACRTNLSKYEFAIQIADLFHLDKKFIKASMIEDFDFLAERRKLLALDVSKFEKDIHIQLPTIEDSIKRFYDDFKRGVPQEIKSHLYPKINHVPYGRQSINEQDIQAVIEVLKSSNLTQGPKIREFENELCRWTGAKYAVAVNSGTSALHLACLATGIHDGDEGITSTNSFVASSNCIAYCGATPVFADIDSKTYNISPEEIKDRINQNTKVIIPVHFAGQSSDMEKIRKIVKEKELEYSHKIHVIEDAAHALGSRYKEHHVGSCFYSDMTILSFHPVKHITTAEGGAILMNDETLFRKLKFFSSHGITSESTRFVADVSVYTDNKGDRKPWYYEQQFLGFNYRMTDVHCALGVSQLKRFPQFIKRRKELVQFYNQSFADVPHVQIPYESDFCDSNFHLYVLLFDFEKIEIPREEFMHQLLHKGISTQVHYIPIHTQPYYQKQFGYQWGDYPAAEKYYQKSLSIPLYPALTDMQAQNVVEGIKELCGVKSAY